LDKRLPFRVATTTYETELNPLLRLLDSAAYFVYKEGGEPVAPFNTLAADALQEVARRRELCGATDCAQASRWRRGAPVHADASIYRNG